MAIKSSVLVAPTNVLAMGHPFIVPRHTPSPGVLIGINALSKEPEYFDPWAMKDLGILSSMFGIFLGLIGHGKSAAMKIIAIRLMLFAAGYQMMRTVINDYKPEGKESEYGAFSRICRSKVFQMAEMRVNPFEPRLYESRGEGAYELGILEMAEMLCEFAKKADLKGHENTSLRVALYTMLQHDSRMWSPGLLNKLVRSITADQINAYFSNLDNKLDSQLTRRLEHIGGPTQRAIAQEKIRQLVYAQDNHDLAEIQAAGDYVSTLLGDILTGSHAKMFGDTHSLYDTLTQRAVTKDWRGMDPEAETLMRIIDTRIKTSAIENGQIDLLPHIEIDDEKHKAMDNLVYARSHSFFSEISRGTHTCNLSATHRFDSMRKGGAGSELYNLANTIINNLGFVFIGRQVDDQKVLNELQDRYELSNADTKALTVLPKRTFGMKLGETEPLRYVRFFATPNEMAMLGTNSATDRMVHRPDVFNPQQIEQFAKENNIALHPEAVDEDEYVDARV